MAIVANNVDIYNAIRNDGSVDFQRRIPAATKASLQDTLNDMWKYQPARNEFIDALVNRIGLVVLRDMSWSNPLAKYKLANFEYGDTIEEVMAGLLEATAYDANVDALEGEVFGQMRPEVQSSFHKVNRQDRYKLTVNHNILRRAFLNEANGLSSFVSQLLEMPYKSDQWDEFLLTTSLIKQYHANGGFFKVNVPDVTLSTSDAPDAKYFLRRVRELADTLPFMSRHYNAAGLPVATNREDLELFITPEANAAIDVEALAAAFNIERSAIPSRTTVIPKEHFGVEGAQAVLTTKNFFVIADQLTETQSMANPAGLYTNYWLHRWQVVSASRFVPAILFTSTEANTEIIDLDTLVSSVTIAVEDINGVAVPTNLVRGERYQIVGTAVTSPTGGYNDAARIEIEGHKSQYTYLTNTGILNIGPDEDATSITIRAIATDDNNIDLAVSRTIIGEKVDVWPNPYIYEDVDGDNLLEVTPKPVPAAPTSGTNKNKVTIPEMDGVDYKDGATTVSGTTITLTANKTITAVAQAGYEITAGATASWNLVFTA